MLRLAVTGTVVRNGTGGNTQEYYIFSSTHNAIWNLGITYANLPDVLNAGLVTEAMIDTSVVRLMKGFISLGVLDPPDSVPYNR